MRWLGIGAFVLILAGCVGLGTSLLRTVREVNEPDPATYAPERLARIARFGGIEARVERVLYVNRDVNAGIFLGRNVRLDPSLISNGRYREGIGRWGTVSVRPLRGGKSLVAFCAASTRGEWAQAQQWFGGEEAKAVREWAR